MSRNNDRRNARRQNNGGWQRASSSKAISPKHFERLRRVMMGHENFDDMCERYQDAKAAGDNVDDPKVFYKP